MTAGSEELIEAAEAHARELSARWSRMQGGHVEDSGDMLVFVAGPKVPWTNGVRGARLAPAEAEARVLHARETFVRLGVPATWYVSPLSRPADLPSTLERAGVHHDADRPIRARSLADLPDAELPDGVTPHRVDGPVRHEQWMEGSARGFGMDPVVAGAMRRLADVVGFAPDAPWQRFVALDGDRPVGTSGLMVGAGVAGVYNVSTVPEARRRGIGSAMTVHAMRHAAQAGLELVVLGAAAGAEGIYRRLGFRRICLVGEYVWDPFTGEGAEAT